MTFKARCWHLHSAGLTHETAMRYLERHCNLRNRSLILSKWPCSKQTVFQAVFSTRSNTLFLCKNEQISFRSIWYSVLCNLYTTSKIIHNHTCLSSLWFLKETLQAFFLDFIVVEQQRKEVLILQQDFYQDIVYVLIVGGKILLLTWKRTL